MSNQNSTIAVGFVWENFFRAIILGMCTANSVTRQSICGVAF
jgi:hypothetical protein